MGDSIADGVGSTRDANRRWSDALAERLQADPALASIAGLNAGIAGNRILNDGVEPFVGTSSLSRFDRDALDKPGVRWVILLQGSNDISASDMLETPKDPDNVRPSFLDWFRACNAMSWRRGKAYGAGAFGRNSS